MKVKDLLEALKDVDPEMEVILQKDSEGNGYSPLASYGTATYVPENTWSGNVYETDWTADDCCMEEDEYAEMRSNPLAFILAPTN